MFNNSKLFFWTVESLLTTLIFFLWRQMGDLGTPAVTVFNTIVSPFLIAGFLYYISNPVVNLLEQRLKVNRILGILLTLIVWFGLLILTVVYLFPILITQLTGLVNSSQFIYSNMQIWIREFSSNSIFKNLNVQSTLQQLNLSYVDILQNVLNSVTNSLGNVVSAVINTLMILAMTPIFLVYFLVDGGKLLPMLKRSILKHDNLDISSLLISLNKTVSRYISGISIDAFIIFILAYVGYSVIGLRYSLIFAIFSGFTNLIPYVGPTIGLLPMVGSHGFTDPEKTLLAVVYMLIVQQIDGNILYPRIVGGVMKVHPITIMVLLLLSSNIYGITGMIVAVPVYSIIKEIIKFLANLYDNHKAAQKMKQDEKYGILRR